MTGKFFLLISTLVLSLSPVAGQTCQIQNIEISAGNTSATISWDLSEVCERLEIFRYEVQWEHVKYEACDKKEVRDKSNIGSVEVPFPSRIAKTEENLHPYSTYRVFIKVTTKTYDKINATDSFTTTAGVPVKNEKIEATVERFEQALRFHWTDPDQCQYLNGRLEKYIVELQGLDPWIDQSVNLQYNDTLLGDFYAENLQPFTSYLLRVYTRNTAGLVSREPLDIKVNTEEIAIVMITFYSQAKTLDTRPLPPEPERMTVKVISSRSVLLSWLPPYPPTGELDRFQVANIVSGERKSSVNVSLAHKCPSSPAEEKFCYLFDNLSPDTDYGFQVRVWNRGQSQPSDWSQTLTVNTTSTTESTEVPESEETETETVLPLVGPGDQTTTPPSTVKPKQKGKHSDHTIIIILCLTFGLIFISVLVTALIYKLKIVRLKQQMRSEEMWNQGRDLNNLSLSASYLGNSSITTQLSNISAYAVSMNTSYQAEIQSRRLPEPPPVRNRAEQENQYSEAYELDRLPGVSYEEMSPSDRSSRVMESTVIQEEENYDTDGVYLRPTFPNFDLTPVKTLPRPGEEEEVEEVIAQESYVAPDLVRSVPPSVETESNLDSLNFQRLTGARLSETSQASSVRTSPSEPLIKSITVLKPVDV